jgi:hypothetical protein
MTQLSGGLSRRINVLADKTLLAAYAGQTHTLTPDHLDAAAGDAEIHAAAHPGRKRHRWAWLTAGLVAALGLLAFIAWQALAQTASPPPAPAPLQAASPPTPPQAPPAPDAAEPARQTLSWLAAAPGTHAIQLAPANGHGVLPPRNMKRQYAMTVSLTPALSRLRERGTR